MYVSCSFLFSFSILLRLYTFPFYLCLRFSFPSSLNEKVHDVIFFIKSKILYVIFWNYLRFVKYLRKKIQEWNKVNLKQNLSFIYNPFYLCTTIWHELWIFQIWTVFIIFFTSRSLYFNFNFKYFIDDKHQMDWTAGYAYMGLLDNLKLNSTFC